MRLNKLFGTYSDRVVLLALVGLRLSDVKQLISVQLYDHTTLLIRALSGGEFKNIFSQDLVKTNKHFIHADSRSGDVAFFELRIPEKFYAETRAVLHGDDAVEPGPEWLKVLESLRDDPDARLDLFSV